MRNIKRIMFLVVLTVLFVTLKSNAVEVNYFPCPVFVETNSKEVPHIGKYRWGYLDRKGKIIISPEYFEAHSFKGDLALVLHKNGKYGFINKKGDLVIPAGFEFAEDFYKGSAHLSKINFMKG